MLEQLKENFGGDIKLALQTSIESTITSPTTKAKLQWALEEIERLEISREDAYDDGYSDGFSAGEIGPNDDW
jgi:hypothetical protein